MSHAKAQRREAGVQSVGCVKRTAIGRGWCVARTLLLFLSPGLLTAAEPQARYLAVFVDGTRIEGQTIADWQSPQKSPRLDATPLMDPQKPLRWLLDRKAEPPKTVATPLGVVEFVGGDRLPGRVVGFEAATAGVDMVAPPHLLVETATEWGNPNPLIRARRPAAQSCRRPSAAWSGTPSRGGSTSRASRSAKTAAASPSAAPAGSRSRCAC